MAPAPALLTIAALIAGLLTTAQLAAPTASGSTTPLPPAPDWVSSSPWTPQRPASCPATPADPDTSTAGEPSSPNGTFPWPSKPSGVSNPENYAAYDHTSAVTPPVRPSNWDNGGGSWKLTSARTGNSTLDDNPQELCGVQGSSVDQAWQVSTGRPSTVIAVTDSGIEWCDPGLVDKIALNRGALPEPENSRGLTKDRLERSGTTFADRDPYDLDNSGLLNAAQYASDPRVMAVAQAYGGLFCATAGGSYPPQPGTVTAMDLVRTFGTPTMPVAGGGSVANPYYYGRQSPAGFTEAIAGWNFVDGNNNPYDSVHYDHGTGEAQDSTGAANTISDEVGACPNCMILPIRVGDSFVTSANQFAQGVLFATDSGASVIQEALGTYDDTATAEEAVDYANAHGVPVIASAADEEAQHHNLPSALSHTIVVNSVTRDTSYNPPSYLYLNGCTNYGANISVSVESSSCSSEATGKASGIVGLLESAAADEMDEGKLAPYPGLQSTDGRPVPLSANEVSQLVTMGASSVDFGTAAPPNGPADNYTVSAPNVPLAKTTRYPSHAGFNQYFGYGRIDAAHILQWVSQGDIPPQAEIDSPSWFGVDNPDQTLNVTGMMGTTRAQSWRYQVDVGVGADPDPGSWHVVDQGTGQGVRSGLLAQIPLASVASLFPAGTDFGSGPVSATGQPDPDKFTLSVRVVVQDTAGTTSGMVGIDHRALYLDSDPSLLPGYPKQFSSSIDAAPTLAPIGPGGTNVMIVATADGTIHAYLPDGSELPGWPVQTDPLPYHAGEDAFTSGSVRDPPRGELVGGVAVGDLRDADGNHLDVVACDLTGRCYAWSTSGQLLRGFPVSTNPAFSGPAVENMDNRVLPGVFGAPALADLEGNGQLDIVASAMDRHVYAWTSDGSAVPGWPVLVVNPSKVASINPGTDQITFTATSGVEQGTKLMDTPAIGNLSGGSGPPDVVVGSNEEYAGPVNADLGGGTLQTFLELTGQLSNSSNGQLYAISPQGTLQGGSGGAPGAGYPGLGAVDFNPAAFLPGWPVGLADFEPALLPDVGDGVVGSPALADITGNGQLDVAAASVAGPGYVLTPTGSSLLGTDSSGLPDVLASGNPGPDSNSTGLLGTSIPALSGPVLSPLGPSAPGVNVIAPTSSLGELLDEAEPADQTPHDAQVSAWSASSGTFDAGFPQLMDDLMFLSQPIVANVAGPVAGPYVVAASATYDVRALNANGQEAPGFPKFTGGWVVNSPSYGPFGRLGTQVLATGSREGELFVWNTSTPACASSGPWPRQHHDLWNTGNLDSTGVPASSCPHQVTVPAPPRGLSATGSGSQISLTWADPSSEGGSPVTSYEVFRGNSPTDEGPTPIGTVTGTTFTDATAAAGDTYYYEVAAVNAAGPSGPSNEVSLLRQTVPSPPAGVSATGANASATVTWTVPDDDGGSPIVSYTVSTSGGGGPPVTVAASACSRTPPTCRATVSALANGTPYTFSVVATNALGVSTAASSKVVTPGAQALAPGGSMLPNRPESSDTPTSGLP